MNGIKQNKKKKNSNIRAEHILVDSDGDIKLCGHNDVTWMISEGVRKSVVYDFKGEPEWMAPEILAQVIFHSHSIKKIQIIIIIHSNL